MKRIKITVRNGSYPLSHVCDNISDAYGCMLALSSWVPMLMEIDLNEIMETLVDMCRGNLLSSKTACYKIEVMERSE